MAVAVLTAGAAVAHADFLIEFSGPDAARGLDERLLSVTAAGSVVIEFHGDAATGCAGAGSCDEDGTVAWTPGSGGALSIARFVRGGHATTSGYLFFGDFGPSGSLVASVRRRRSDGTEHACGDAGDATASSLELTARGDRATLRFASAGTSAPLGVGTRCGGPLATDVAGALPSAVTSLRALRRGHTTVTLASTRAFAAHGLAGTVTSSLVVHVGRVLASGSAQGGTGGTRSRFLRVPFAVAALRGQSTTAIEGSGPSCAPLDSCGASGRVIVSPRAARGKVVLLAIAPRSVAPRRLEASVGLVPGPGAARADIVGGGLLRADGDTTAALDLPGDPAGCHDTAPLRSLNISMNVAAGRLRVALGQGDAGVADPLRTRCPGPALADVLGGGALASGSVPVSALRRRTVTVHLTRGQGFAGDGYRGRSDAAFDLVLRRGSATASVSAAG